MDRNYYCITFKKMRKKQCSLDILAIFSEKSVVLQIIISPFVPLKLKRKLVGQLRFSKNRLLVFYMDHLYIGLLVEIMIVIEE